MKFRKTQSRGARKSVRKTQRQHQRKRRTQRKSQRSSLQHSSLQRGGGMADDTRRIPDDAYITEQIDPSSTPVLIKKTDYEAERETPV